MPKKILKKESSEKKGKVVKKSPKIVAKKVSVKKATVKKEEIKKEEVSGKLPGVYFYGLGKRKTAVAQVRLYSETDNKGDIVVNKKDFKKYFPLERLHRVITGPLTTVSLEKNFQVSVRVSGGGVSAQAEAVRLGIARALVKFNEDLRKSLKAKGFLTRDSRKVERKKPGKKKARRSPQWAKR